MFIRILYSVVLSGCLCWSYALATANTDGGTGLLSTPTAEVLTEGRAEFSMGTWHTGPTHRYPGTTSRFYAVSIGFLPNLELTGRFNDFVYIPDLRNNVSSMIDRSVSARYRLYNAEDWQAALGAIDLGGESQIETSYYGVVTYNGIPQWDFSAGIGSERFDGGFGGVRWTPSELVSLIGEVTTEDVNYGLELRPLKGVAVKGGVINGEKAYFASYSFPLNPRGRELECCPVEIPTCETDFADGCAQANAIRDALVAESFENVLVGASADTVYVAFESRRFREQLDAMGVAAAVTLAASGPGISQLVFVQKVDDVPLVKLRVSTANLQAFFSEPDLPSGGLHVEEYADTGFPPEMQFAAEGNKKPGGGDLQLRLTTSVVVNEASQPAFRTKAGPGLQETAYLARGLKFQARQDWPLFNDITEKTDPVNRDALLTYFDNLWTDTYIYGTGGYIGAGRNGGKAELASFFEDGRYKLSASYAHSRDNSGNANAGDNQLLAEAAWFDAAHDLQLSAKAGQFIGGDQGLRVEATRFFGPTELTFFAYDTDMTEPHGGFRVFLPLPWFSEDRHGSWRTGVAPEFGYQYRTDSDPWGAELLPGSGVDDARQRLFPEYIRRHLPELRRAVLLHLPACVCD